MPAEGPPLIDLELLHRLTQARRQASTMRAVGLPRGWILREIYDLRRALRASLPPPAPLGPNPGRLDALRAALCRWFPTLRPRLTERILRASGGGWITAMDSALHAFEEQRALGR